MAPGQNSYKSIFKSTFLFSFVRVFQILTGIIKNKVVAVLLGAEGIGIIGILSNAVQLLQSGAGLGISQSAVRDISEANVCNDTKRFSHIIFLTNRVILFTCFLGCLVTIGLSPLLSKWTFGDKSYTVAYIWMSLVVGLNILTEGQLAILTGMRQLRALAKASMIGSVVGLVTAVPMYYFFGKAGIVPSLIITAVSAVIFSNYFVRKIKYDKTALSIKEIKKEATPMAKMGVALMLIGFFGALSDLVVAAYIRTHGGLEIVGYYRAGTTIISSYFGIVLTAMVTDYYPRISAVYQDNTKLQEEVNQQSEMGLILIFPIAVLFVFLSPLFINILYSKEFIQTISYTDFAMLGTIIIVCSNSMGMILLAKQEAKIFTVYSFLHRLLFIPVYFLFYNRYSLLGLGLSYLMNALVQLIFYRIIIQYRYGIKLAKRSAVEIIVVIVIVLVTVFVRRIEAIPVRYFLGIGIFLFSCLYSYNFIQKYMNISLCKFLKNKTFNKKINR